MGGAEKKIGIIRRDVDALLAGIKKTGASIASTRVVVENILPIFTEDIMRPLFEQFPGLVEYKHLPAQNLIKLQFQEPAQAECCVRELHHFNLDGYNKLKMKFGEQ